MKASLNSSLAIFFNKIIDIREQGFPQVLRTWGALQNFMAGGGGLSQYMWGA